MNFRHILADVIPKLSSDISQNLLEIHSKICHNSKVDIWHELDLKVPDVITKQNLRYCNLSLGLQPSSATVKYILNIQVQEINTQKVIKIRLSSPKTGQKSENASIWRAKKFPLKMTSSAKKNFHVLISKLPIVYCIPSWMFIETNGYTILEMYICNVINIMYLLIGRSLFQLCFSNRRM